MSGVREPVAIVGIHIRCPGADSVEELWRSVVDGRRGITRFDPDELVARGLDRLDVEAENYVLARGILPDVDLFDPESFGMAPREAEFTDPQHRLLLEGAWEVLERSGHAGGTQDVAVFAGTGFNYYFVRHVLANPGLERATGLLPLVLANEKDHVATKIAYRLGLTGPAVTVQNACSTSLVAVHLAVQALRAGEAKLALAGGATVSLPQYSGYAYETGSILSRDGQCRPLQPGRDGTVPANGVVMLALRLLRDAEQDGDHVIAVIRGTALANDGADKPGYTTPGVAGQSRALRRAYQDAGIDPGSVGYVETHGTGTEVGDDIELAALGEVFPKHSKVILGAVKAGIGHVDAAAGATGLAVAALALHERVLPPIAGADVGAKLSDQFSYLGQAASWPTHADYPRRAGVSSFGIGGTNAHVVLEEHDASAWVAGEDGAVLVPVSARTPEMAQAYRDKILSALSADKTIRSADVAQSFMVGRRSFPARVPLVLGPEVSAEDRRSGKAVLKPKREPRLVVVFGGQGTSLDGALAQLAPRYPTVRATLEQAESLPEDLGDQVRRLVLEGVERQDQGGIATEVTQLATYLTQVAIGRLIEQIGCRPVAFAGHSIGEYAAAHLAGEFTLSQGLDMVLARARAMAEAGPGAMLAVATSEEVAIRWTTTEVDIAAVNGPDATVLAGPQAAITALEQQLISAGILARQLAVPHAFHSPSMSGPADRFGSDLAGFVGTPPARQVVSTTTGKLVRVDQPRHADYWAAQIRRPVRFHQAMLTLAALHPHAVVVEIGPGRQLSNLIRGHGKTPGGPTAIPLLPKPGLVSFLRQIGQLWAAGAPIDLAQVNLAHPGRRVPLPTYPFERRSMWIGEPVRHHAPGPEAHQEAEAGETRPVTQSAPLAATSSITAVRADPVGDVIDAWQEILGVDDVGPDADFYSLGGDSFTMVRLASRLVETTGRAIRATDLLLSDLTPRDMARVVSDMDKSSPGRARP